jgi:hypothetical protein
MYVLCGRSDVFEAFKAMRVARQRHLWTRALPGATVLVPGTEYHVPQRIAHYQYYDTFCSTVVYQLKTSTGTLPTSQPCYCCPPQYKYKVQQCAQLLRTVLTKTFFRIFGIISGFVTVGTTC